MRVKMLLLVLCVLFMVASVGFSYDTTGGMKGGITVSNISGEHSGLGNYSDNVGYGFSIGPFARIGTADGHLAIQTEFLYTLTGNDIYTVCCPEEYYLLQIFSIEIPVLVMVRFPISETEIAPFLYGGSSVGIKYLDSDKDTPMDINFFQVGGILGAGLDFGLNTLEFRYSKDLRMIDQDLSRKTYMFLYSRHFQ